MTYPAIGVTPWKVPLEAAITDQIATTANEVGFAAEPILNRVGAGTWLNALGNCGNAPVVMMRLTDSFGSDYANTWWYFDNYMSEKYNGLRGWTIHYSASRDHHNPGLWNINGNTPWPTVQGTTLTTRGISGYAQQLTSGLSCVSSATTTDWVRFQWLADAGSTATGLLLQINGSTVQTVDGRANGQYDYVMPNGLTSGVTVGYVNNGVTSCTVDSPYIGYGNRTSGYQPWDLSHIGFQTATFNGLTDLPYYLSLIQPHAVVFTTQTNDASAAAYRANCDTLWATVQANTVNIPTLGVFSCYQGRTRGDWVPFQAAARDFAVTNNAVLMDMFPTIGIITGGTGLSPDTLGWTVDGEHPDPRARQSVISSAMAAAFDVLAIPNARQARAEGILQIMGGTAYTISGNERQLLTTASSAVTITVAQPSTLTTSNSGVYNGQTIKVIQGGTGAVTFAASSGNIRATGSLTLPARYSRATLEAISDTEWLLSVA